MPKTNFVFTHTFLWFIPDSNATREEFLRTKNVLDQVRYEISNLELTRDFLRNEFTGFQSLRNPSLTITKLNKRSILPFVGKAFSFLFGTISEDDLTSITNNIHSLSRNQNRITHVLNQSLTVIKTPKNMQMQIPDWSIRS